MTKRLALYVCVFVGMGLVMLPASARAAGTTCGTADTNLTADGRILDFDFLANGATGFYRFDTAANRSYSVEVRQDYDDDNTDFTVTVLASDCSTAVALHDTTGIEPLPAANTVRGSFNTAAGGSPAGKYYIKVVNGGAVGHYLSVRISDTTLFGPQWTTFGGHYTSWSFQNTTNGAIHGTLILVNSSTGTIIASAPVNSSTGNTADNGILPGKTTFLFTFSNGISLAGGLAGNAVYVNDGPPGALIVGSFTSDANSVVLLPVKFEPVRAAK